VKKFVIVLVVLLPEACLCADRTPDVKGGLVVRVGCDGAASLRALRASEAFLVQGLDRSGARVAEIRKQLLKTGDCGPITVRPWDGRALPYRDGVVNLLLLTGPAVDAAEIKRVLAPRGVARVPADAKARFGGIALVPAGDWLEYVKPVPAEIDDWSHYLHGPSNNAVSADTRVAPPGQLQWKGGPEWARHHDHQPSTVAMVSAAGRVFTIMDEGPISSIQLPPRWVLAARDAFNGKVLWKRRIASWWPHLWPNKKGYVMGPRRLVADAEAVYCTLGLNAPLTAIDAATGALVRTYAGTRVTEEFVLCGRMLFAIVTDRVREPDDRTPMLMRQHARDWPRGAPPTKILAIDKRTGKQLWARDQQVRQMTLAADRDRVCFHDGKKLVALSARTGAPLWESGPIPTAPDRYSAWFGATLVLHKDVVLFAGGEKVASHRGGADTMTAVSATDGKTLWTAPHPPSGYDSPEDLFVIDNLAWCAPLTNRRHSGMFLGHDLRTGAVKRRYPDTTGQHMPHHRCHRAKATASYILTSRTGIEFVDVHGRQKRSRNDWVRGGCLYGIMPANGLIYTPPHACACYVLAKLTGFCALAPRSRTPIPARSPASAKPEKGPAYGKNPPSFAKATEGLRQSAIRNLSSKASAKEDPQSDDWPMYRHDAARSGSVRTEVAPDVRSLWQTRLPPPLTAPVVAGGRCYVASVDAHTVHALDAADGAVLWRFTAGGRIDSPPTVGNGRVVFGCRDGWVYCLRARDGALIWRSRAAPLDRQLVVREQLESLWPVHGSVLLLGDEVHCTAGRCMFLEGGIRYLRFDVRSGKLIAEHVMDDRHPETGKPLDEKVRWPDLPTARQDLLSCDGRNIYMRTQAFDRQGKRLFGRAAARAHLFSSIGLLDDTWWHRSYWIYGSTMRGGAFGWPIAGHKAPTGRVLVFDKDTVYGFRRNKEHLSAYTVTTWMEYHLFAMKKTPPLGKLRINEPKPLGRRQTVPTPKVIWSATGPMLARAMVLTPKALFVAGLPDVLAESKLDANLNDPQLRAKAVEQSEAWLGRRGGMLWAVSPADGKTLATRKLKSPPVFDGMAAANGRLFVCLHTGAVACWGK